MPEKGQTVTPADLTVDVTKATQSGYINTTGPSGALKLRTSDIDIELNRCREQLKAADEAFWKAKYSTAEDLYRSTLTTFERLYPGDSPNVADCAQKLGDTYYFRENFASALPLYKKAAAIREKLLDSSPSDVMASVYKLARALDKLGQSDEAERNYRRALELAQKSLPTGHVLTINCLEAYASFIERLKPDTKIHLELRKKAEYHRSQSLEDDGEAMLVKNASGPQKIADSGRRKAAVSEAKSSADQKTERFKKFAFIFLVAPLLTVAIFMVISVAAAVTDQGKPIYPDGAVLSSLDGHKKILIKSADSLEFEGTTKATVKYSTVAGNAWRYLSFAYQVNPEFWYTYQSDSRLLDPSHTLLYPADSPELKTASMMRNVAVGADKYAYLKGKMPTFTTELTNFEPALLYKNPYTNKSDKPAILYVRWNKGSQERGVQVLKDKLEHSPTLDWEDINTLFELPPSSPDLHPGAIICLAANGSCPSHSAFFVVGVGPEETLLKACDGKSTLYFWSQGSRGCEPNCQRQMTVVPNSAVVISDRTPRDIKHMVELIVINVCCFAALLYFNRRLSEQLEAFGAGNSMMNVQSKVTQASQTVTIYTFFLITYVAFTVYIMFAALTNTPLNF